MIKYKPYADFKYVEDNNVSVKLRSAIGNKKQLSKNHVLKSTNKFNSLDNISVNDVKKNSYELSSINKIVNNHQFFYGVQSSFNSDNYFFDFILGYETMFNIIDEFYCGFGCMAQIPYRLFSKNYNFLDPITKQLLFIGPIIIPIAYCKQNFSVALKIQALFLTLLHKGSRVFNTNQVSSINTSITSEIYDYSYFSEYGFIHLFCGIEVLAYMFSGFFGLRFCTHLEELDIVHLIKHISLFSLYSMFYRASPCYSHDSVVFRRIILQEGDKYVSKMMPQQLLLSKLSFCSLDFVFNICMF